MPVSVPPVPSVTVLTEVGVAVPGAVVLEVPRRAVRKYGPKVAVQAKVPTPRLEVRPSEVKGPAKVQIPAAASRAT